MLTTACFLPSPTPPQCPCCDARTVTLAGVCMPHSAPLLSLLWAVGAGAGQMYHLELAGCHTAAAAAHLVLPPSAPDDLQASAFQHLSNLVLSGCAASEGESLAGFLSVLLPQLPALASLTMKSCHLSSPAEADGLGEALSLAPHLTSLVMNDCNLEQLPEGAYLAGGWAQPARLPCFGAAAQPALAGQAVLKGACTAAGCCAACMLMLLVACSCFWLRSPDPPPKQAWNRCPSVATASPSCPQPWPQPAT